ncbi:hypothetical protein ACFWN2_34155 [Lentzea sp. NPDC058436]|uniref:hypothetical protein n=1 Tax=Lentzea sp. NPDC058436 TaxID=3346499 RepID=UPI0036694BBB
MTSPDHGPDEITRRLNDLDDELKRMFTARSQDPALRAAFLAKVVVPEAIPKEAARPRTGGPKQTAAPGRPPRNARTRERRPGDRRALERTPAQTAWVSLAPLVVAVSIYLLTNDLEMALSLCLGLSLAVQLVNLVRDGDLK